MSDSSKKDEAETDLQALKGAALMKNAQKGTFGYLKAKRTIVLIRTIIYFGISLSLFFAGIIATDTRKNLLTVVAVLGCLPACKSLVNLIMYLKASGCSKEAKERLSKAEGSLSCMYDMYFTSYKENFAISHMTVAGKNICGYTEDKKCNVNGCEDHLAAMLKQAGYKELTVKIFTDLNKYCERLHQLNALEHKNFNKNEEIQTALYDISL